ncbi:MAG: CoA transferase [Steroidobacteraceae bacterium]|nr:CoA transferase [Steroidobacteraceae bacterium]MDW8260671.1 CoA transferase [Gammaproteobacteria bacterium]
MNAAVGAQQPFHGLKVMDLAWVVAGPLIGRTLAEFGATVVRIESRKRVETARLMGPFPGGQADPQRSVLFDNCNVNKLGLTLDLTQESARQVALDLACWADVVIESFMPGQMAKFGLAYDRLRALNPRVIMVSTSLLGQTGPYAQFSGYGNIGAALAGYQMLVGRENELPVGPFGPYTDFVAPRFAIVALLAALDHRERTGEGAFIDVSQAEAGVAFLAPQVAHYALSGRSAVACGNRDPQCAPHGVYRCRGTDAWVAIVARDDDEWRRLALHVGGNRLAADPRFADLEARKRHEDALDECIAAWTATRTAAAVERELQSLPVPAHVVANSVEFCADPQLLARGHFVRLERDGLGESVVEASRYSLSATPAQLTRSAPTFGRDTTRVLKELLGYDDARIAALSQAGALT